VGSRLNGQMAPSRGPLEIMLTPRARGTADLWQAHALMLGGSPSPKILEPNSLPAVGAPAREYVSRGEGDA
jgi:hypothetical protein